MESGYIFISYNWSQRIVADKINEHLKGLGLRTWIDTTDMTEKFMDNMRPAIEQAAAILIIVSLEYKRSANCRREYQLASSMKKETIFVLSMSDYKPEGGWFSYARMGKNMFIQADDLESIGKRCLKVTSAKRLTAQPEAEMKAESEIVAPPTGPKTLADSVEWVTAIKAKLSDNDQKCLKAFEMLSEELNRAEARQAYAEQLLPNLGRLIDKDASSNPQALALVFKCLIQFALDDNYLAAVQVIVADRTSILAPLLESTTENAESQDPVVEALNAVAKDLDYVVSKSLASNESRQIMISYNWASKVIANRMADLFRVKAPTWKVWIDVESLGGGSLMEKMAAAVASSDVIVVVVAPGYENSLNCKSELTAARKWNKHLVYVLPDKSYNGGTSWLGMAIGDDLYYDISDPALFEAKLSEICKVELAKHETSKSKGTQQQASSVKPSAAEQRLALPAEPRLSSALAHMRTKEDVLKWLKVKGFAETSAVYKLFVKNGLDPQSVRGLIGMSAADIKQLLQLKSLKDVLDLKGCLGELSV